MIEDTLNSARVHLREACTGCEVKEVVADKGYRSEATLDELQNESYVRAYIPELKREKIAHGPTRVLVGYHRTAAIVAIRSVGVPVDYSVFGVNGRAMVRASL
tara:strand:- start:513 stop:821 length:309 start_codon:yes stop_codon:yes gene_type:complete